MVNKRLVDWIAWFLGAITAIVYLITSEPSLSFWDSGEFILTASTLQVGHPPGAPFYQLIGAFVSIFSFGNPKLVPILVNSISSISSGLTITFLFWIIHRLISRFSNKEIGVIIASIIGALTFAFTDSFWNNAIEAEVYAMAIFLVSASIWAIIKWYDTNNTKLLLLVSLILGVSIGVHIICLLVIPTLFLAIYFKRFKSSFFGIIATLTLSIASIWIIIDLALPGIILLMGKGIVIGLIFIAVAFIGLLLLSYRFNKVVLNIIALSLLFFLIGFSSYLIIPIRAYVGVPVNEFNPSSASRLESYFKREAYGETPLLYGPVFTALPPKSFSIDERGLKPEFHPQMKMGFPRVWNYNDSRYAEGYMDWIGVPRDTVMVDGELRMRPSWIQNLRFFSNYQVGYMYTRYLLWNFSGRTNDLQGYGDVVNGEWMSGIGFVDNLLNREENIFETSTPIALYAIPLILGLIGLMFHLVKDWKWFLGLFVLFIMTSIGIILFNNEVAYQPRERDYIYVVSFMAFSVWIAIGAFAFSSWIVNLIRVRFPRYVLPLFLFLPIMLFASNLKTHNRNHRFTAYNWAVSMLNGCKENAILFTNGDNDTFPLWYAQAVEGIRRDIRVVNLGLLNDASYILSLKSKAYESSAISLRGDSSVYSSSDWLIGFIMPNEKRMEVGEALDVFYSGENDFCFDELCFYTLPTNRLYMDVSGRRINFSLDFAEMDRSTFVALDIIASNIEDRPIYYSDYSISDFFGLDDYIVLEGLSWRLDHGARGSYNRKSSRVNTNEFYHNFMVNFSWKNFNKEEVYYDEINRNIIEFMMDKACLLAEELVLEGDLEKAWEVAEVFMERFPIDLHSYPLLYSRIGAVYGVCGDWFMAEALTRRSADMFSDIIGDYISSSRLVQRGLRYRAIEMVGGWIDLCNLFESYGMNEFRVIYSDALFDVLDEFLLSLYEQLYRLKAHEDVYGQEIENVQGFILNIRTFAKKYEESLPELII